MILIGAREQKSIIKVYGISANVWSINGSDWRWLSDVPNFDVVVPGARDDVVGVVLIELDTEDSIGVTWFSSTASLELTNKASSDLIVDSDDFVRTTRYKLSAVRIIINCAEGVELIEDSMK